MYSTRYIKTEKYPNKKFVHWINKVEKIVHATSHMYLLDLPDNMYMVNFESGMSSVMMAKEVLDDIVEEFHDY
jgi:hypothetical protein